MSKLVCIRTYPNRELAELYASQLDEAGIKASVYFDDAGGASPHVGFTSGGARLFVLETQAEKALGLMGSDQGD